jgi:hypothetical protein
MPLLHDELDELGLGDWWRSTFLQEERGYIEWKHLESTDLFEDERLEIPLEQVEQIEVSIAERYNATALSDYLAHTEGLTEEFYPEDLRAEMLSPRALKRLEEWWIARIEAPRTSGLREVRKDIEWEAKKEVIERYKSSAHSKAEIKRLDDDDFKDWRWSFPSNEKEEQIRQEIVKLTTERYEAVLPNLTKNLRKNLLLNLAYLAREPEDRSIANRIHDKAKEFFDMDDPLDLHHWYRHVIGFAFRGRDPDPVALAETIEACEKQIAIASEAAEDFRHRISLQLPYHTGYERLAIIREKQRDYTEAIRLATQAKEQGWEGDWDKRIERCKVRIQNQEKRASRQPRKAG